jgi:hypothetical protein
MNRTILSTALAYALLHAAVTACNPVIVNPVITGATGAASSTNTAGTGASNGAGGASQVLVTGYAGGLAGPMAVDATNVYWIEDGLVQKVSKDGGAATSAVTAEGEATDLAVDATHLYWSDQTGIHRIPTSGGARTDISFTTGPYLTVDATSVYWSSGTEILTASIGNDIPSGGVPATVLASGLTQPGPIAVDAMQVYWADALDATIKAVAKGGGSVAVLASDQGRPIQSLVVAGGQVFWTKPDNEIGQVPVSGGAATVIRDPAGPSHLVSDAAALYWIDQGGGIKTMPLAGGPSVQLVDGLDLFGLAVDATSIYWADSFSILKAPK